MAVGVDRVRAPLEKQRPDGPRSVGAQWCVKWNLACEPGAALTLIAVNAHVSDPEVMHVAGGEACSAPSSTVHTLYIPVVKH